MFPAVEEVNGVIVGGEYRAFQLYTPTGKQYRTIYADDLAEGQTKALEIINHVRAELGEESKRLGYDKPWELREYD